MTLGKITTSKGYKTRNALQSGYIEPHPTHPCIYLSYDYDSFVIKGYSPDNKRIHKVLTTTSITQARKELFSWTHQPKIANTK